MSSDNQTGCDRILSDYATDVSSRDPIETVRALASAGFGSEASAILSCLFSSGPKVHPLPRGYTAVAVHIFNPSKENEDGFGGSSDDRILLIFGVDITQPNGSALSYCYRLRYAAFGKIGHIYPCTNEEHKKYYDMAVSMMQGGAQGPAQQPVAQPSQQQRTPARRAGSRLRRARVEEEMPEPEESEPEEEVSEDER